MRKFRRMNPNTLRYDGGLRAYVLADPDLPGLEDEP